MKTAIAHGKLVTGDGKTCIEDSLVLVHGDRIDYAGEHKDYDWEDYGVFDASGKIVMPGVVNTHAHGIAAHAPMFSSGSAPLGLVQSRKNLHRHLSEGTTSILSVDGFGGPRHIAFANDESSVRVRGAATYASKSYVAAMKIDSSGIVGRESFVDAMFGECSGLIVAVGECGSGATLGGGVQDYKFIPEMIKAVCEVEVSETQARQLKEAVLGRHIDLSAYDEQNLAGLISLFGIESSPDTLRELINSCVMPSFGASLSAIMSETTLADYTGLPAIVHSAAASINVLSRLSSNYGKSIIAAHSNHPSYTIEEALDFAHTLKKRGVVIDISTFDTLHTGNRTEIEYFMRFLESGLVDTVTTDYGGGNHTPILAMLNLAAAEGVVSLPHAVMLATSNPAKAVPGLGYDRGLLQKGHYADIVIADQKDISRVSHVFTEGILAKKNKLDS